jgi:hypothetical protein
MHPWALYMQCKELIIKFNETLKARLFQRGRIVKW